MGLNEILKETTQKASCYTELKRWLEEKKSKKWSEFDDVHHQEVLDKMNELENNFNETHKG